MGDDVTREVKLDWSSAEVHDGKLAVALEGRPKKKWKDAFDRTIRLLNRGAWDEVTLKKGRVSLRSIKPGDEDRVRHFLESVVLEANSALAPTDDRGGAFDEGANGPEADDEDEDPTDREMTERLRSFAGPASGG